MKKMATMFLTLSLVLSLLMGLFPVSATPYDWSAGVPADWLGDYLVNSDRSSITATNILDPVNPNASQEARNLYAYLCTLTDSQNYLIGQFDIVGDNVTYQSIKDDFGLEPAMYSCHYKVDTTAPTFDGDTAEITNSSMTVKDEEQKSALLKAHYENGNVLLLHSDSAPRELCSKLAIRKGLYADEANCVIELDETNPNRDMQVYALWKRYQDSVLQVLKNLEASGVKAYLWRPWVEFNYHEFSGTDETGYQAFTRVFQQTVQNAIDAGLTGFLATYSPGCWGTTLDRNPGNKYVDVYAATMYSEKELLGSLRANQYSNYDWYVKTGKPVGFSEFSCRSGGDAAIQARGSWYTLLEDLTSYWPNASWFNIWGGLHYSLTNDDGGANGNDDGGLFLDNPFTLHLGEIADYQNSVINAPGVVQVYTGSNTYQGLEQRAYTAADLKALGLSLSKMSALRINTGYAITFYESSDCSGDGWGCGVSMTAMDRDMSKYKSCEVTVVGNVALDKWGIYGSVNDGDAWKANDGYPSPWSGDANSADNEAKAGTAWLYIDLDEAHTITYYVLKNAGYAGQSDAYNTRDFQLQYSKDGTTWKTVDTVTGNTASQVSRNIQPTTAQHFRLLITAPNSSNIESERGVVTISEFELYGVPVGAAIEPEPTTTTKKPTTTTTKKVTTTTKKTTKKTTTTTALKLATPKVTVSNATKGVKVSWGKVSKADKYYVYRKTGSGSWSKIKTTTSVSYTDESAKAGKSYQYMVKAVKGSVTSGYKAVSITRLSVPKVTVSNASKGVKVSWGKVTGASKYYVYRKTGSGSWSKIKTTTSTSYTDTKAAAGKSYQYMVKAVKGDYTSYYKAASIRRLKAPSSVKLAKATKGFKVSWSKVTGATKYEVYRKTGNGSYTKIATTTKTAYTDKTAKKGKYYTYRVRAVYSSYKSEFKTGSKTKR